MTRGINYELDFEKHIESMEDRPLLEFIARETLMIGGRVTALEKDSRRLAGIIGGVAGAVMGLIIAIINFFAGK